MNRPAQSQPSGERGPIAPPATIPCDLCGFPMAIPQTCIEQGAILGLLVCTQCTEDELQARVQ